LIKIAREFRVQTKQEKTIGERNIALSQFEEEIKSDKVKDMIQNYEIPNVKIWSKGNIALLNSIIKKTQPEIKVKIGKLDVLLYIDDGMSPNDPYVIFESTSNNDSIIILVNQSHLCWQDINNEESILNFIRHCVYDGYLPPSWSRFNVRIFVPPDAYGSSFITVTLL